MMMRLIASTAILLCGSMANAALTAVNIENVAQAGVPDVVVNDVRINFDGNLSGQAMILELTAGSIHQDGDFGSNTPPSNAIANGFATAKYDTFVAMGSATSNGATPILESSLSAVNIDPAAVFKFDTTGLNVSWAPAAGQIVPSASNYLTSRITLTNNATGTFRYLGITQGQDPSTALVYSGSIANGVISFSPETDPILGADVLGTGTLSQQLQGAFANGGGGPIILPGAIQATNTGTGSIDFASLVGSIVFDGGSPAGVSGTATNNGSGLFGLQIAGPWTNYAPNTVLSGNVVLSGAGLTNVSVPFSVAVPEPSTVALSALALVGLVGFARRKK